MPGFEEGDLPHDPDEVVEHSSRPVLIANTETQPYTVSRDREDELSSIAAAVKTAGPDDLASRAVVFKRPLPYVYLARDVFADAGVPYQTFDALPLAAEPYAAALDLVFEFVTSNFTREPVVALLGSPHFSFEADGAAIRRSDVAGLNRALADEGYFGGLDNLRSFERWKAAKAAVAAADELTPLSEPERPSVQLDALLAFVNAHDRVPEVGDPLRERHLRARRAVLSAIHGLRRAHQYLDDSPVEFSTVAAMIRRWIEGQTFSPRAGHTGVQLLDAQAARYGEFDEVFLVGLVEGEWPQRSSKSIFYPASLLSQLDWPDSRMALAGERAAFHDLMALARRQVHLSTFELENDSIVGPSVFLEDADRLGFRTEVLPARNPGRLFVYEALALDPVDPSAVEGDASAWLGLRTARSAAEADRFHGAAGVVQAGSVQRQLARAVPSVPVPILFGACARPPGGSRRRSDAEPERARHFRPRSLPEILRGMEPPGTSRHHAGESAAGAAVFGDVIEPLLAKLPEDEAAVQRTRLLGSAADEGLAEAVFQLEAEWETPVRERLLEHSLEGEFDIQTETGTRRIALRGKADRIDLLEDRTFRIIDYKLSRAPDRKQALQLPVYTVCTVQHLRKTRGEDWEPGQAGYIAFGQDRQFVPMLARGKTKDATLVDAQTRLLDAVDRIERGEFPPTPADTMMCTRCAHAAVCRKDYVGDV